MKLPILTMQVRYEQDVVSARQRARQIAGTLGFEGQDQARFSTAVSEIVRNGFRYAGGCNVRFLIADGTPQALLAEVEDTGSGIADLDAVMSGNYRSQTGMGMGLLGARRLSDRFSIESGSNGTKVVLGREFTPRMPRATGETMKHLVTQLERAASATPWDEIQRQNMELVTALSDLRGRQEELERLNRELDDTNRGVVALYAELDEKADFLRRVSEIKTHFLSNMSHEFRTPLNSILSLSRLLLDRLDGDLSVEQEKQVTYIRKSAQTLLELVNDLLDLAKVEAGKVTVRASSFEVADLFSALRGMLRPLLVSNSVDLIFEVPEGVPTAHTDEAKVSQVLRNLISNALKFTERGEVRVSAEMRGDIVMFRVADTGIGIAPEDHERIFEDFVQVENAMQKKLRGTGLGLPLSRKLSELLGGQLWVESRVGEGSTFFAAIPLRYHGPTEVDTTVEVRVDPGRHPVLIVDDNRETLFIYEKLAAGSPYQIVSARSTMQARRIIDTMRPVAIILDVLLDGETAWGLLSDLKRNPSTYDIPVYVVTILDNQQKALSLGADGFRIKPIDRSWLMSTLDSIMEKGYGQTILLIDDDEASRYLVRNFMKGSQYRVVEASSGKMGLSIAPSQQPAAVILDLYMPDMDGFTVLEAIRANPELAHTPVIVHSSKILTEEDRQRLTGATMVLSKEHQSRESILAAVGLAIRQSTVKAVDPK